MRGKSTTQSYRTPIYFVDLTLRDGVTLKQAVQDAQAIDNELSEHGFDQAALEEAAKQGYVNSCFEIDGDDLAEVAEEFYPMDIDVASNNQRSNPKSELVAHNVTNIEQGLRQSVTAVS